MTKLSTYLGFHKRRFYDAINILDAIGCCTRMDNDTFLWNGLSNVNTFIQHLVEQNSVYSEKQELAKILPEQDVINLKIMTQQFILCFIALQYQQLNIKEVSNYFSRNSDHFKTIVCKLYQITHVLTSIGIIDKTKKSGEYKISDNLIFPMTDTYPFSIPALLKRQVPWNYCSKVIEERRTEYRKYQNKDLE
ncbi:hypothetical protein TVAG_127220 [Trichomonas vaginalis G3]|uniref:E2F/DP family winged-helix DNA-binding domain-containing protein n=1 Tax=Trichomonas vaginalis (strain ATCC PRA-98 / G3) TaxID=412133 RepID=A2E7Y9_TRIV3|nr:e2F-like (mammalian transcription factor) family [Trichomonas vaginalis G3]EAY11215.1 hypothetical protein TVAG_127220 [Trichomonas vaginalis G3]KAI5551405.1 e2F-like (mammalian transcription factor) family [Trichomonas vaginalis G3]|eukprot:XP_001323438.1 hypothetical protein [Trichomonas vaginalis G3]